MADKKISNDRQPNNRQKRREERAFKFFFVARNKEKRKEKRSELNFTKARATQLHL